MENKKIQNLKRIQEIVGQLKEMSILKTPESQALVERLKECNFENLSAEDMTSATLLLRFSQYQNLVCDLIDVVSEVEYGLLLNEDEVSQVHKNIENCKQQMARSEEEFQEDKQIGEVLGYLGRRRPVKQILDETSAQWDIFTEKMSVLSRAISDGETVGDLAAALIWQVGLYAKSIDMNLEAVKFAHLYCDLVNRLGTLPGEKTEKPTTLS